MATARDRYQNHTYSESRDRGEAEHAAQDVADGGDYLDQLMAEEDALRDAGICPVCFDTFDYCPDYQN